MNNAMETQNDSFFSEQQITGFENNKPRRRYKLAFKNKILPFRYVAFFINTR